MSQDTRSIPDPSGTTTPESGNTQPMTLAEATANLRAAAMQSLRSILYPDTMSASTGTQPTSSSGSTAADIETASWNRLMEAAATMDQVARDPVVSKIKEHLTFLMSALPSPYNYDPSSQADWELHDDQIVRTGPCEPAANNAGDPTEEQEYQRQTFRMDEAVNVTLPLWKRKAKIVQAMVEFLNERQLDFDLQIGQKVVKINLEVRIPGNGQSYLAWTVRDSQ